MPQKSNTNPFLTDPRLPRFRSDVYLTFVCVSIVSVLVLTVAPYIGRWLDLPTSGSVLMKIVLLLSLAVAGVAVGATPLARKLVGRNKERAANHVAVWTLDPSERRVAVSISFIFAGGSVVCLLLVWRVWLWLDVKPLLHLSNVHHAFLYYVFFTVGSIAAVSGWGYLASRIVGTWELKFFREDKPSEPKGAS